MLETVDVARVIISFILTVFVIFSLYYFLTKYNNFFIKKGQKGDIKIKDVKYIGKGKSLLFIQIKDKEILLSVEEQGIKILEKWSINEKEEKD